MNKKIQNKNVVNIEVDTNIFDLNDIFSVCYLFLDKAYIKLEESKNKNKIIVKMKLKVDLDLNLFENDFNNKLIEYVNNKSDSSSNDLQKVLLHQILFGKVLDETNQNISNQNLIDFENIDDDFDDPEDIAIPWEEKYNSD